MASTIKVDNVQNQPGTNIINKCSVTTTIGAGAGETVNVCAATVNLGRSGGTVNLTCGATQSGFGRTGTVDWNTTKITADPANAVSGTGYFCDTSGGGFTVTLPTSPSAGDIVAVSDYTRTWGANNLIIGRNSKPIGGVAEDAYLTVNGQSATFVFVDDTEGWINIQETQTSQTGQTASYVVATGGSPCTGAIVCTNYKVHTFTGPGTFTVSCAGNSAGSNEVSYMVIAGGGGAGGGNNNFRAGGGGAGGYREGKSPQCSYTASPITCTSGSNNGLPVSATPYPITVGGGGTGAGFPNPGTSPATSGVDSVFSTITSTGGGKGGGYGLDSGTPPVTHGTPGGSGGGGGGCESFPPCGSPGGTGNTPVVSPAQGKDGGNGRDAAAGGGGGGAGCAGSPGASPTPSLSFGGDGVTTEINGSPVARGGGGGGGQYVTPGTTPQGGAGGGGNGGFGPPYSPGTAAATGCNATVNTGGGGGGAAGTNTSGNGGDGIVIIRYKFQ